MIRLILKWLTGGVLDRILSTVDAKIKSETNREKIKGDIIMEHMRTRIGWMQAGGFWTLMLFAVPTAFHYGFVTVYSSFWCKLCMYPVGWSVAALPEPMASWEGYIVLASIGGLSLLGLRR